MSEAQTQRAILDYLAAQRILHCRMNTGAMKAEHNGKTRFLRFGRKGMADILAFPKGGCLCLNCNSWQRRHSMPLWIEVKSATGRQSPEQKAFQAEVEADGHSYLLVRDVDDLRRYFENE